MKEIKPELFITFPRFRRGMTLIDVVVGTAIMLMIFLAIFGAFQISIQLVFSTKAKTGAVALITDRMEYIRGLPYSSVGVVGGIPAGNIDPLEQVRLNGVTYTLRTLVQYEDAPEDGLDDLDENGITADYKVIKVEALWNIRGSSRSTFLVSRMAPVGEESLTGGGTLRVNVFDAAASPVQGADVRIINDTADPAIDTTVSTNDNGTASFPGAPEESDYEISVSKDGYSGAQTYGVTVENPNPSPGHVAVVEGQTTTVGFAVDTLGSLTVRTYEPPGPGSFHDLFNNADGLSSTDNISVSGGSLHLSEDPVSGYSPSGSAFSQTVSPSFLNEWNEIVFDSNAPSGTSARTRLYYYNGSIYTPVPDEDLTNNSTGFSSGTVDISSLDTDTYDTLQLGAFLDTTDASTTPEILEWSLSYVAGPTPLPSIDFDVQGTKTIGTTEGGQPIYKYEDSLTTNQSAEWVINPLEWDTYLLTLPSLSSYTIAERCPNTVSVSPGGHLEVSLWLEEKTTNSLRVVAEEGGSAVPEPNVSIVGPSNDSETGTVCGQTYFGGLTSGTYSVTVSKSGYLTHNEDVGVSGKTELVVDLIPN